MLRLLTFIAAFCYFMSTNTAQTVKIDSTFSGDGYHLTASTPVVMYCYPLDVHPNGNIFLGGIGENPNGLKVTIFAPNGDSIHQIQQPLLPGVYGGNSALKIDSQGRIVFNNGDTQLWRYFADGSIDSTFGINGVAAMPRVLVREIDINAEGKIYGAGDYLNSSNLAVVAFTPDGIPDSTFSDDGIFDFDVDISQYALFFCLKAQADGKILVSGFTTMPSGNLRPALTIRLNPDGNLDDTFADEGILLDSHTQMSEGYSLAIQPDQKILVGGYTLPPYMGVVARYLPNGQRDSAFGEAGVVYLPQCFEVLDILIRPNGKLLLFVWNQFDANNSGVGLIQLLEDGSLDLNFGVGGEFTSPNFDFDPPMAMAASGSNKIVAMATKSFYTQTSVSSYLTLQQFIFDFNVGVLNPSTQLSKTDVLLYPNPVSQTIHLKFEIQAPEWLDIQLIDAAGKVIQTVARNQHFEAGQQELQIQISDGIPTGTYWLNIMGQGKIWSSIQWIKG